ncbi:uncharacterized protein LOC108904343 isoform X1 [Anoplophora glabripennis]|uniref:uncharacterized protein LOC108904343 isoform X1 n=2 Tax=Anoplophora glabripennis TaxID=217634 RepID=UPI00087494E4|nr:uncharacterized protein LOC108904343 isoform X1 [Anoplophora glabripennis]
MEFPLGQDSSATMYVPDHVVEHLRCDLCRRYLSIPPITTHEDKISCGRCDPGWHRNMAYERLAQFAVFPCTYCEKRLPWDEVPRHEERCRQGVVLCCSSFERKFALSRMPAAAVGEYHKECQWRTVACPFDYCDSKYQISDVLPHFDKFHKGYVFSNNLVSARKILKEEKVWNYSSDNQVCLILFRQMPFLVFVHSDCNYNETTGDIISYDYQFGVFSFCKKQCDIKYTASITLESEDDNSHFVMKNQEVKPFNDRLHLVKFIRIGLVKQNSFNFLTTKFKSLNRTDNLILTYTVKLQDNFKPTTEKYPREQLLKIGTLGKNFECPICNEYMCAPVYNCSLGHTVCKSCKSKMAVCPFCKAFIGNSRNFALEDILETLRVACQNEDKGCEFSGSIPDVQFHELKCVFNG